MWVCAVERDENVDEYHASVGVASSVCMWFVDRAVVPSGFSGCHCCLTFGRKAAEHLAYGSSIT